MHAVIAAVDQIRLLRDREVRIDVGIQQEYSVISKQLQVRLGSSVSPEAVETFLEGCDNSLRELRMWVTPYELSGDYLFFIEYYGGLAIQSDDYSLQLFGEGPMVEEWYTSPMGDDSISDPSQDGVITIGFVSFREHTPYEQVYFLLDLAGVIQPNAVIGVPIAESTDYKPQVIVKHLEELPGYRKQLANSFTEFLELVAATKGALGYI